MLFPNPETAAISLAFHAERAWLHRAAVREALERRQNRCHDCKTAIPGYMEIHHLDGNHANWKSANLVSICHFCHLARHPAQPGLTGPTRNDPLSPIWWPKITQQAICALAWAAVWMMTVCEDQLSSEEDSAAQALHRLREQFESEVKRRIKAAAEIVSTASPGSMLNATVKLGGEPDIWGNIRWWPKAAEATGGDLLRWVPGEGIAEVPVSHAGAELASKASQGHQLRKAAELLSGAAGR